MTRGAWLLLLLLSSWLLASPALRLSEPARPAPIAANGNREASVAAGDHLLLPATPLGVPRAPLLARLPVPRGLAVVGSANHAAIFPTEPADRRDVLRRVQLRRRLPRLGGDDPPWS